MMVASQSLDTE